MEKRVDERPAEERRVALVAGARRGDDRRVPGPDSASTNGPLALAVFTNTTRFDFSFASSGAKSCGVMSGPVRLNFATFAAKVPCPKSTITTVSSCAGRGGQRVERLRHRVAASPRHQPAASRAPCRRRASATPCRASVVPHFLNSSPCSGVPASPTTTSRCVDCANAASAARQADEHQQQRGASALSRLRLAPRITRASTSACRPHSAHRIPTSAISRIGMCHSSRSSTAVTPRPGVFQIVRQRRHRCRPCRSGRPSPARSASGAARASSRRNTPHRRARRGRG